MATLGDYMAWIRGIGGKCQTGIASDPTIGMVPVTKIVAPGGRHVIHAGNNQSERLSLYTIEMFDRRLQVISPFRSVPRA